MPGSIDIDFSLHPAQMEVFNDQTRFRVLVAGRRFGKSYNAVTEAACAALDERNAQKKSVYLIAPTQPQAKLLYWQPLLNKLHAIVKHTNVNEGMITLNTGVVIGVKGADSPDSLRGIGLWFVILDEVGSMKPQVWTDVIRPALADVRGRALFIGTPPYGRNQLYELYNYAVNSGDADWKAWRFPSSSNPFLPPGEIEAARSDMSSATFKREFLAQFDTAGGGLFKADWIRYEPDEPDKGGYLVTVDLAGFSAFKQANSARQRVLDKHCIVTAKVTPGDTWWIKNIQTGRWGVKETATRIVDTLVDIKPLAWGMERGALFNAVWPYIQDEAAARNENIQSPIPLSHENRIKAERIVWALQGRMEHGKVFFNTGDWNPEMEDEVLNFPSPMIHDDIPDALSYVAQLAQGRTFVDFKDMDVPDSYWNPVDRELGI